MMIDKRRKRNLSRDKSIFVDCILNKHKYRYGNTE